MSFRCSLLSMVLALGASTSWATCPEPVVSLDYGRGNRLPNDIAVRYGLAYAVDSHGLTVYRLDGPNAIEIIGELAVGGSAISISGDLAAITGRSAKLVDISTPRHPRLISTLDQASDVAWTRGHVVLVSPGHIQIVDVRDPEAPVQRGRVEWSGPSHAGAPRAVVDGFRLLVATRDTKAVLIDLTDLDAPEVIAIDERQSDVVEAAAHLGVGILIEASAGLEVVDLSNNSLATIGTLPMIGIQRVALSGHIAIATTRNAVVTINLSRPENPQLISQLDGFGTLKAMALGPGEVVVADASSGLRRVDLGNLTTLSVRPEKASCHGVGRDIVVVGSTAIVANGPAGLTMTDVRIPQHPREVSRLELHGGAEALLLDAGRALLMVAGTAGLHILDVSRPRAPESIAFLPLEDSWIDLDFGPTADTVLLASERGTVIRARVSNPHSPILEQSFEAPVEPRLWPVHTMTVVNGVALLGARNGVWSFEFQVPGEPAELNHILPGWDGNAIAVDGVRAIVSSGPWIYELDVTTGTPTLSRRGYTGPFFSVSDLTTGPGSTLLATMWGEYTWQPTVVVLDTDELEPVDIDSGYVPPPEIGSFGFAQVVGQGPGTLAIDPETGYGWATTKTALTGLDLHCSVCPGVTLTASPEVILTGGAQSEIQAHILDLAGHPVTGAELIGTTTLGTLSQWTEAEDGMYAARLVSGPTMGRATVRVAMDGYQCADTTTVMMECSTGLPEPPSNLTAEAVPGPGLQVAWEPAANARAYTVYRSTVPIATIDASTTGFLMTGLSDGATYTIAVSTTDECDQESEPSDPVEITLPGVPALRIDELANVELGEYTPTESLAIRGEFGYSADTDGVAVWNLSDPTSPQPVGRWSWRDGARDVTAVGDHHLLVTTGRFDLGILDISEPSQPQAIAGLPFPHAHGRTSSVAASPDGRWCYVGSSLNVLVVDLANPLQPEVVAIIGDDGFRDVALAGNRLVGVREDGRLTLVDVSDPTDPEIVNVAPTDQLTDQLKTAQCVAATGSLAVVGLASGAAIVDLTDGSVLARVDDAELRLEALRTLDDHRVAGVDGHEVWTIDVSDPSVPTVSRRTTAPAVELASGAGFLWLASAAGVLRTVDLSTWTVAADLTDQLSDAYSVATAADGTIAVANGGGGLVLLDTADPSLAPTISARVRTPGTAYDVVAHSSGHLLVADGAAGLTVMTTSGDLVARLSLQQSSATTIEANDELAVLGSGSTLFAVDVTDPTNPQLLSSTHVNGGASSFGLIGNRVHLEKLDIDLTNPRSPVVLPLPEEALGCQGPHMAASLPLVFVANRAPLTVCRQTADGWLTPITDEVANLLVHGDAADVALAGSNVILLGTTWLYLIDSSDPASPVGRTIHVPQTKPARSITFNGRIGYITSPTNLSVVVLTGSLQP